MKTINYEGQKILVYEIAGYNGKYLVSKSGEVFRFKYHKLKKISINNSSKGYPVLTLSAKKFFLHRILAIQFIPNPDNKPFINHINGIKNDFSLKNLEWCTTAENNLHLFRVLKRVPVGKLDKNAVRYIRRNYSAENIT
ncbi:MAG: HNH endonuclease, partial [Flavobacterium sp.]|nr:HNH endonuclease [Flavobacterium sp.]